MVQPENNLSIRDCLAYLIGYDEIYVSIQYSQDVSPISTMGGAIYSIGGHSTCVLDITIKQRNNHFLRGDSIINPDHVADMFGGLGLVKSFKRTHSPHSDVITEISFFFTDPDKLQENLNKLVQEKSDAEFTQAFEDKISED